MSRPKKPGKEFIDLAVDAAVFGAGSAVIGSASQSVAGNKSAKAMVDTAQTLYATKMLKRSGRGLL